MPALYEFMLEVNYNGDWINVDYMSQRENNCLRHEYLDVFSEPTLGHLSDLVKRATRIPFKELAENTQEQLLCGELLPDHIIYTHFTNFFILGRIQDLEALFHSLVPTEYYVSSFQIADFESGKIDVIDEYITVPEFLALPAETQTEYRLYQWIDHPEQYNRLFRMIKRTYELLCCFTKTDPDETVLSREISDHRIIFRMR